MSEPQISVIMSVYNGEKYITQTIQSVLEQTFTEWELIIVDDGSTDLTSAIISKFLNDGRIKYHHQLNGKQGKARNFGISKSTSNWIAFVDADDLWMPNKLSTQIAKIKQLNEEVDVLFTSTIYFDDNSNQISTLEIKEGFMEHNIMFPQLLSGENKIVFSSVVMKKQAFLKIGAFDETPNIAEDYNLWLRMFDNGYRFYGMEELLVKYRIHEDQTSYPDSKTFILSVRAFSLVKFTNLQKAIRNKYLKIRVNRYLVHNLELLSKNERKKIVQLYKNPLNSIGQFILVLLLLILSPSIFKRFAYRHFELNN